MIEVTHLNKYYGGTKRKFPALQDVSFAIEAGESVAIMGKSGAGKTTLLNILGGLDSFDEGVYTLQGQSLESLSDSRRSKLRNEKIGFIMQDFALLPQKSVFFNVMLPLYFDATPWHRMKGEALLLLKRLGIDDLKNKKVSELSGGEKQRVAIVRALIKNPPLLLADEPTGSLDSETTKEIMKLLMEQNRSGTTMIIVTHDEEIAAYCSRRILLSDGKIVADSR